MIIRQEGAASQRAAGAGKARAAKLATLAALCGALLVSGCREPEKEQAERPRPVRTITAEKGEAGETATLTGQILAEKEAGVGFRIGGRILERFVGVGDRVTPDKLLARLDPQDEQNALRSARAALSAAEARLVQARNAYDRQSHLMQRGFTTRAQFDQAEQEQRSATAAVDDSRAQLQLAEDRLSYTELRANVTGAVTRRLAEAGEVVQPGQIIFQIARDDGRDAVFDAPASLLRGASSGSTVTVNLTDDASVSATGRVRVIDPQADPVTRTFRIRVGLIDPPEAMRLGETVTGHVRLEGEAGVSVPASALTRLNDQPAVWIVDPQTSTVALRNVEVARFDPASVLVADGIGAGEIVVTAGVQALHPGQKVRLVGAGS
ncbi:efflux RND transporter periplasmic adaptor subunit [Methylocella sp.]|uniref:efflux RND transporter periplasmic adaptor subunit n=1 Tax=Methylocella sp. TaxID=1978226 RepID=UPI0037845278